MTKQIVEQFEVESDSSSKKWKVSRYDDGSWACSCPAWIFHKGQRVNCKHIKDILFKQQQTTLTITELTEQKEKEVLKKRY